MDSDLLQQLSSATAVERDALVLEMSLSLLADDVKTAVMTAAIPHWFDALYLEALLETDGNDFYDELLLLNIVDQLPGKGYAIHERTRRQLLHNLWQADSEHFRALSARAANYCHAQTLLKDDPEWEAETIYHLLVSDPDAGISRLRGLATKWANYEYHTYDEIERALRWANEQIEAGRLIGDGANWTRLWQAKLALIYNRPDLAATPLNQITTDATGDLYLSAEIAQTQGDLFAQLENEAEMSAAWQTAYELYKELPNKQGQLDAYLVLEKMRQHGLKKPKEATKATYQPPIPPSHYFLYLIDTIHTVWIKGVLEQTLAETIDLRLDRAASQSYNLVYDRGQKETQAVVANQRLSQLFNAAEQSLLILGAPGSGKTITLLQLLDELLKQARNDSSSPLPLLFNLSSFGSYAQEEDANLLDWLIEQAHEQYRLNPETAQEQLLEKGNFVLLLDGLDEVSVIDNQREQCVLAINEFVHTYSCGLVVCSRISDYEELQNRLRVNHALVLQPLTNQQIKSFIEQVGKGQTEAMLTKVQNDWQLQEALRSPLLLNLYPRVFETLQATSIEKEFLANATVQMRRTALFASFVDTVFEKHRANVDAKVKSVKRLSFLAKHMQKTNKSLFFIEELQPSWLPDSFVGFYRGMSGLSIGLILGMLLGLLWGVRGGLGNGVLFVFTVGIGAALTTWLTTRIRESTVRSLVGLLIFGLLLGLSYGLVFEVNFDLLGGLGVVISAGAIASWAIRIHLRTRIILPASIQYGIPQYIVQISFSKLIQVIILTLIVGLLFFKLPLLFIALIFISIIGLAMILEGSEGRETFSELIDLLYDFVISFLEPSFGDKQPEPGEGVQASLRNALRITTIMALLCAPPILFIVWLTHDYLFLFAVFIVILPPIFTWFGGLAWCQHWALRMVIALQGALPLRLVPWLDDMVSLGLLRRVGGGYIFVHRSLLEYFAELEEWQTT